MKRLSCLTVLVVLGVLAQRTTSQATTDTISINIFLTNMTLSEMEGLQDNTTHVYLDMVAKAKEYLSVIGGESDNVIVSDGGGCVKINVVWRNGNQTSLYEVMEKLQTDGFAIWGQTWAVSSTGCAEASILRFSVYVVDMQWTPNFTDQSSMAYQQLSYIITTAFPDLGGKIRALEISQNFGCIQFYLEWETMNATIIMYLTSALTTNGITVDGQNYRVQTKACSEKSTVLKFRFYAVNMSWSDNFTDHTSMDYLQLQLSVQNSFSSLGGNISALEIAQNYDCLEFYLEWDALNVMNIMDGMSVLTKNGITFKDQTYSVQTKPCELPPAEFEECPEIRKGTFGVCILGCDDNVAGMNCSEGYKCCSNGCGRTCQRVGYALKMSAVVVINLQMLEGWSDVGSSAFSQLEMAVKTMVQRNFNVEHPSLIVDVELISIRNYSVQDQTLSALNIVFYLAVDVPNSDLEPGRHRLMMDAYNIDDAYFRVIDVNLGSNSASPMSMCNDVECTFGICKQLRSDVNYCSCDAGYVGSDCATFDCRTDTDIFFDRNNSLCQNGGQCVIKPMGLDYECQCQPGFYGPLCQVNLNSCPLVLPRRPGLIGLCQSTCSSNEECKEEEMCCKVPCGGTSCVEVGYAKKMMARITLTFPYLPALNDSNSMEFQTLHTRLETWINSFFKQNNVLGFISAKITSFTMSENGQMARRKRAYAETTAHVIYLFNGEIPVESMFDIKGSLLTNGYNDSDSFFAITDVSYGSEGGCPVVACGAGSFCVSNFGAEDQCACPKSRSGQLCDVKNCNRDGINLCKNGGKCSYSDTDMQMSCNCPPGYTGELCENSDVCSLGLCLNGGICHNMPNRQHFCDCPEGYFGSVCEDSDKHCRSGQPLMTTSGGEQQCFRQPCPIGFMCNVHALDKWTACCFNEGFLCDLGMNPCHAGGTCTSDFNSGTVCLCPQGRKGLFCEEASNDTAILTTCQTKQLLNNWVINILKTGIPSLNITLGDLQVILQHIGYKYFPTDICDELGNFKNVAQGVLVTNPSADTVKICLDKSGNFDPVCSANNKVLKFRFYAVNMSWSDNFTDHTSMDYLQLQLIIQNSFSSLGGSIRALEIAQNYDCLEFYLEWDAINVMNIMDGMSVLTKNGITFKDQTYSVQTKPCELPPAELDECPEIRKGTFGACLVACDDNTAGRNCSEGYKCCSNGCGRTCQRVGYALKMSAVIVINLGMLEGWNDEGSSAFSQLEMAVKTMVQRSFNVENPSLIVDVELISIRNYSVQDQALSSLNVVFYLAVDVPNSDLDPGRRRLMMDAYNIDYADFRVIDVNLGSNSASPMSMCNDVECTFGICKQLRSDVNYCSCDAGYVGSDCATFDCRTDTDIFFDRNNSLCQNGGQCVIKPMGLEYECQCQPGFYGPLCQVNLNSCPLVLARRPGLIGLCQSTCSSNEECKEEEMCCKVPCGGTSCVEVGYAKKMMARITLTFPYLSALNDSNSMEFQILHTRLETWVNSFFKQNNVLGFKSAKITSFTMSENGQMARRKRAYEETTAHVLYLFNGEIPVESMFDIKGSLLMNGYNDSDIFFAITDVSYGSEGGCPVVACAAGSFCVSNYGAEDQCACPKSRSGQLCDVKNCNPDGINLCKNGGKCSYSDTDMQMSCNCPPGYTGELCENSDVCSLGLCLNGGICLNKANRQHVCDCPEGFFGSSCEDSDKHCQSGQPLMTTSGEQQCFRRPCPIGFMCNVHPFDKWTACCFNERFLCDLNPCQSDGECISDFNSGTVCLCPQGRKGLFCEEASSNDTAILTTCQMKQLFNDWVINILKTGTPSLNITLENMRVILQHIGYEYFPTDICDEQGNFKTVAQGVLVVNPTADTVKICLDKSGNSDPDCGVAVCDVLSNNGSMQFCLNGGECLGKIREKLCDCNGTGYNGIRCELSGEGINETSCTLRRDIANLALGILDGTVDLISGLNREITQAATKEILLLYNSDNIFVPYCDEEGLYAYSGCLYMIEDRLKKTCYCALDDGTNFGNEDNQLEPPRNCSKDPDSCPKEWGEECERPNWWCLETVQCMPGYERCAYYTKCTDEVCTSDVEAGCVALGTVLPCDLHTCEDDPFSMCQPCGNHGWCYNVGSVNKTADMGYRCECKMGFSGSECEVNDNICSHLPTDFCESNCIGDLNQGQLCQCDQSYGGIFCDKPARSMCEKQKASYDDVLNILKGEFKPWNGYNVEDMKAMVEFIIHELGGEEIPVLNCTKTGFYAKVQCMVSVNNLNDMQCYCVDINGNAISSNVEPFIGYDICTAPTDSRELVQTACNATSYINADNLTICLNGGTCIFDIYAGKFCECPVGYYGQFCQYQGNVSGSQSVCDFFADAWNISSEIVTERANWIHNDLQKELYLTLTFNFVRLQNNISFALKTECKDDGTFKPAACYHNTMTAEKGPCYCWSLRGLYVEGQEVESADSDKCSNIQDASCPLLNCRYICDHGYRYNNIGCRTCECKNPCEVRLTWQDLICDLDQRCVIKKEMSCTEGATEMKCTKAVCMSPDKPGACPGYSDELFSLDGLLDAIRNASSCSTTCYDDTDCKGEMKCCGLCGNKCINPEVPYSCMDYQTKMNAQLRFITLARDTLMTTRNLLLTDIRKLEQITDIRYTWIPICADDQYLFKPLQCLQSVDKSGALENVSSCFCVDKLGNKIVGANANPLDPASCNVKPFTCPFVEPEQNNTQYVNCSSDQDCARGDKCCSSQNSQVCQKPVDTADLTTTFDKLMSTLCDENYQLCQGGSQCVGIWMDMGIACECPAGRVGPFCEQLDSDVTEIPDTACERKSFAVKVFLNQLQQTNSTFKRLLDSIMSYDDMTFDITSAVWYKCTSNGEFEPKQCIIDAYNGDSPTDCFCVYENGTQIIGTKTQVKEGQPLFCGGTQMTCPSGNAYRVDSGDLQKCESKDDCPMGYTCRRSTYGRLYCCPTEEGLQLVCKQPRDVGMMCPSDASGMQSGTRYYYNDDLDLCTNFTYNGCEGNDNRFSTMEECSDRCITNIHKGTCPKNPVIVTSRPQCPDLCDEDDDCDSRDKCCSSTCGKRCIPTGDWMICPIGYPRDAKGGGLCNATRPCEMGYMCVMIHNSTGACCPDYSNVDQCLVPPSKQNCQDFEERYFYNATSKMCQMFSYGGCSPDFNNFKSLEDCCETCNGEGRCKMGKCPSLKPETVSTCVSTCFSDGGCSGKKICCSNGCGTTCVLPEPDVEEVSDCLSRQMEAKISQSLKNSTDCDVINIPVCKKDGSWANVQCQTALGICWCVSPLGHYINNTITKGVPQCQTESESMIMRADQSQIDISQLKYSACDNNEDFHCCSKVLCTQTCWAHPEAMCRINPCGGCIAEFFNADGKIIDCNADLTMCEQQLKMAATAIQEHKINEAIANGEAMDDMDNSEYSRSADERSRTTSLNSAYPGRCLFPPETGLCKGFQLSWYFDPGYGKCSMFVYGMCGGNDNIFDSPEECYAICSPSANPCLNQNCSDPGTICKLQYDEECYTSQDICNVTAVCEAKNPVPHLVKDIFIPSCQETGDYNYKQCHGDFCWCVNSTGHYVNGLTIEQSSSLICTASGASQNIAVTDGICPGGLQPNITCMKACTTKVCPSQPEALCVADLCSSNCSTKFVDTDGEEVKCTGDVCQVFTFEESDQCIDKLPCPGSNVMTCPESVCEQATKQNCSKNPCAVCMVNPCTCMPYFVDARTGIILSQKQCNYLSLTICEQRACIVLNDIEKAKYKNIDLTTDDTSLPQCDENGVFKPKQCQDQKCHCVDQFGNITKENADGSCNAIDKIKIFKVTFTYNADFTTFKNNNKLDSLLALLKNKLIELGIDIDIIKKVDEPYSGSIKVNVTFQDNANSINKDLALIMIILQQMAQTGALDLIVDGQPVALSSIAEVQTSSDNGDDSGHKVDDGDGLNETEKIIIGVVCGVVGLLIIAIIAYCLCCRNRQQKEAMDDSFETVRENNKSANYNSVPVYNQVYQDDNNSIKVRL